MTKYTVFGFLTLIFFSFSTRGLSQNTLSDSLYKAWKDVTASNTDRCMAFSGYCGQLLYNFPDSMEALTLSELEKAKKSNYKKCEVNMIIQLGLIAEHRGDIIKARKYLDASFTLAEKYGLEKEKYAYYNNIGSLDISDLNYESAIQNFRHALKIASKFDDIKVHNTLHNIALCYSNIGDTDKALDYYLQSLAERKVLKDTLSMLYSYINIGVLYMNQKVRDSALRYFDLSAETAMSINDQRVLGYAEINRADIYYDEGEFDKGIQAAQAAQEAFRASGNTRMEQMGFLAESRMYNAKDDHKKSLELARKFQDTSIVPDNRFYLSRYYDRMHHAHKGLGNYDSALVYLELKHDHDLRTDKAGAAKELENFEAEKRALQDSMTAAGERAMLQAEHLETVESPAQLVDLWCTVGTGSGHISVSALEEDTKREGCFRRNFGQHPAL
jgi:tetratricopeptide (TPR) repeat protein